MFVVSKHRERGLTLVELLVVVAILGLLAVTVLPNIAANGEARRGREAARLVSSFIAGAHARAIGRREWAGFALIASGTASYAAIDLVHTDVPPLYRGDRVPSLVTISGTGATTRYVTWSNAELAYSGTVGVASGDLIRFGGGARWYELSATPSAMVTGSVSFRLRGDMSNATEDSGEQPHNTPWPAAASVPFEILSKPVRSGGLTNLPADRAVDLYWSGYGPPSVSGSAAYMPFQVASSGTATAGATTSILFDGTGRIRQIQVQSGGAAPVRRTVTGSVFLLVGRVDRVAQPYNSAGGGGSGDDTKGANWQYPDSYWIAIDPFSGATKAAECTVSATTVLDSQLWIRQSLAAGGG